MINILPWIILVVVSTKFCDSTLSDLDLPIAHTLNSTNEHLIPWMGESSAPEYSHYHRTLELVPNIKDAFAKYYGGNRAINILKRNPYFFDLESHQKKLGYHQSSEGMHEFRSSPYHDHQAMQEYDVTPLKKHDYGGEQNYGGWDTFSGGLNIGSAAGLAQVGQAVKKGKEAKALFFLMAPLILLAVFGPILATQAAIPWVANGGLTSVSAIASNGKRRRRTLRDPRQVAELEKRMQLFLAVQDFIAKSGSTNFAEKIGDAFLRCPRYTERRNKCLERIACEYTDETSAMDAAERNIAKMVFQNVLSNPMIPAAIKGRLNKGSMYGSNHKGRCRNYWCEAIDGPKGIVNHR